MAPDDETGSLKEQLKEQLAAELKEELASQLREELKKEIIAGQGEPDAVVAELKENSAVLSSTGRILIPKEIRKALGWKKDDVLELSIDEGKLVAVKVGRVDPSTTKTPKHGAKDSRNEGAGDATMRGAIAGGAPVEETLQVSRYFKYDFDDRKISNKLRKFIENSYSLFENGNIKDGFNVLETAANIEIKEEEPDRSKIRSTIINYLGDIFPSHADALVQEMDRILNMIEHVNSRFLRESAYHTLAVACKAAGKDEYLENFLGKLYSAMEAYQDTEMYAIIDLLEKMVGLVEGTTSPFVEKLVKFIEGKFPAMMDLDYRVRCLGFLSRLQAFKTVRLLGRALKEETMEGSGDRRAVLDALKENREREKQFKEKHPDYELEEDGDEEWEEETSKKKKDKKVKKKTRKEEKLTEKGEQEQQEKDEKETNAMKEEEDGVDGEFEEQDENELEEALAEALEDEEKDKEEG